MASTGGPGRALACQVGQAVVGVDLTWVRDVVFFPAVVRADDEPAWVVGTLRIGHLVVPVLDLRIRLGLPLPPIGEGAPVVAVGQGTPRAGVRVDRVCEVVSWSRDALDHSLARPGVTGVVRLERSIVELLDLEEILDPRCTLLPGAATPPARVAVVPVAR